MAQRKNPLSFLNLGKGKDINKMVRFKSTGINLMSSFRAKQSGMMGFDIYTNIPYWNEMFYSNDEYATACILLATLESGYDYQSDNDKEMDDWKEWSKAVDFDTQMERMSITKYALGNGFGGIVGGVDDLDHPEIVIQNYHPYKVFPKFHSSGFIESWDVFADQYKVGKALGNIPQKDMIHLPNILYGDNALGLALGQAIYERLKRKRDIEKVCNLIAESMIAPMKHITCDLEGLDYDVAEGETISEAQQRINDVDGLFTRRVKPRDDYIYDVVTTDDSIKVETIKAEVHLNDVVNLLSYEQNLINSALIVPPVFKGMPGGSNRATSYNELVAFAQYLKGRWSATALQLESKLLPQLFGTDEIKGSFVYEPLITEDKIAKLKASAEAFQKGLFETNEDAIKWAKEV